MRSSASTSSGALALAAIAALAGCGGGPDARLRDPAKVEADANAAKAGRARLLSLLPGRWTGEPVEPPEGTWFEKAKFDIEFSDRGDVSVVVTTFATRPYPLRFEGTYEAASGERLDLALENLGGAWRVERADARGLTLANEDMKIALVRRYGS